jgi:hypothetical protein
MDNNTVTALATVVLAIVGFTQIGILFTQNRQNQLDFIEEYRKRWLKSKKELGKVIFIGRTNNEYYQVLNQNDIKKLTVLKEQSSKSIPTIWALNSAQVVFTLLSDICIKILQNQINIRDIYPIFETELLRHSRPLRVLLEKNYPNMEDRFDDDNHIRIRTEIQDWLIYHDGIRRRCLILIDLLWAEASRLEDLPPDDLKSAADAKIKTGILNRTRVYNECIRLNGFIKILIAVKLSNYLKYSEYKDLSMQIGLDKKRLKVLEEEWTKRLLNKV